MIEILRYVAKLLGCFVILIAIIIAIVGELWVLRVAVDWWLGVDYIVKAKDWWWYVKNKISGL